MIPLFGLWTFLRDLLFGSTAITLENLALRVDSARHHQEAREGRQTAARAA